MERGYLINAAERTITALEIEGYKTMQKHLPGGICIGKVFDNGDVLYVDEEGLLKLATVAFRIRARPDGQPMMSHGILTGRDGLNCTLPPEFTIAQLQDEIEWLDLDDALAWFRAKADQPAITSQYPGEAKQVHAMWADLLQNLEGGRGYDPRTSESMKAVIQRR